MWTFNLLEKILTSIILCLAIFIACYTISSEGVRHERDTLKANQTALLSDIKHYKTQSGKDAASIQQLTLKRDELESYCDELNRTIKDLKIKLKRVQSISQTATQSDYAIVTSLRDSVIYRDSVIPVHAKSIRYSDAWIDLDGYVDSVQFIGDITTRDTLIQVVHRVPKRFLFIRYGTKAIQQDVVSSNPHTKITYMKFIKLD